MQNRKNDFIDFIDAAYTGNEAVVNAYINENKLNIKNYQESLFTSNATHLKFANWQLSLITIARGAYVKKYENIAKILLNALEIKIEDYENRNEYEERMEDVFFYSQMEFLHKSRTYSQLLGVSDENFIIYQTLCDVFDIHTRLCLSPGTITYKDYANALSIREFYNSRLSINRCNTYLHLAVEKNDIESFKKYIKENKTDALSEQSKKEVNSILLLAFHKAVSDGQVAIVQVLVDAGVDVNSFDENPALIEAARQGYIEIVDILLSCRNIEVDILNYAKQTALMCAGRHGHTAIVKKLLDAGAKINIQDENGLTALIHTILYDTKKEYAEIIKLMLSVKDINLSLVCEMVNPEEKGTALIIAIHQHHADAVKALIVEDVNVNEIDNFTKHTPLTLAAWYAASFSYNGKYTHIKGSIEVFEALLEAPFINLFAKNKAGQIAYQVITSEIHPSPDAQMLRGDALRLVKNAMRSKATVRGSTSVLFSANANNKEELPNVSVSNDTKQSLEPVNETKKVNI